jgi:5-methylcytosine-specific restriction endonuclease McrA
MTLAPLVDPSIRGIEGNPGALNRICAAPGCGSTAQQRHHIWPRSYLRGQPVEWVSVHGRTFQNTVGLCVACHQAVTGEVGGHRAHIRFNPDLGLFEWWVKMSESNEGEHWVYVAPLSHQGLVPAEPEAKRIRRAEGLCSECGRPLPHEKHEPSRPRRRTATWGVVVPEDEEIGADVLDDWIDQYAVLFGFGEATSRLKRYHVLAVLLAWVNQNRDQLLADLEEAEYFAPR